MVQPEAREQAADRPILGALGGEIPCPLLRLGEAPGSGEIERDPLGNRRVFGVGLLEHLEELESAVEPVVLFVEVDERRRRLAVGRVVLEKGAVDGFGLLDASALGLRFGRESGEDRLRGLSGFLQDA